MHSRDIISSPSAPGSGSPYGYPAVIHALKGLCTKEIGTSKIGTSIWQRGYYDYILRNDADLAETRQYILNTPPEMDTR